jgi:hypothetical protein
MVDFKLMAVRAYAEATPEERARIDAYNVREAKYDATRREMMAKFTYFAERPLTDPSKQGPKTELYAEKTCEKPISVRIEDRVGFQDREFEIIRFIGGSTGHEAFALDEDFAMRLLEGKWAEPGTLWICAGSARYTGCSVKTSDIINYIEEMRPHLLGIDPTPKAPPVRARISF